MMRLCGLIVAAAVLCGVSATAGHAQASGPMTGLEAICLEQGGTFQPGAPVNTALCTNTGLVVYSQIQGSYERSGLVAIDRLCKAAGFGGVHPFGKGTTDGGFAVAGWGCFATA
jgi:hypothetical protein